MFTGASGLPITHLLGSSVSQSQLCVAGVSRVRTDHNMASNSSLSLSGLVRQEFEETRRPGKAATKARMCGLFVGAYTVLTTG